MFAVGLGPGADTAFSIITMLIAIPTGIKIFNWVMTLWGGRIRFCTPLYFALGFISMFTLGGLSGVMHSSPPVDLQQTDSYFVVAHLHYVLFGGSVFALFAGAYYWWPKAFGIMLDERLGRLHFWLMLIGFNVTFFPMHFLGLLGMPRRIYTYAPDLGWSALNLLATVGAFVLASSLLVFVANVARTIRHGSRAESDPGTAAPSNGRRHRHRRPGTSTASRASKVGTTSGGENTVAVPKAGDRSPQPCRESGYTCRCHPSGRSWWRRLCSSPWLGFSSVSRRF
jgi:cytochrome c oxidase subunit I